MGWYIVGFRPEPSGGAPTSELLAEGAGPSQELCTAAGLQRATELNLAAIETPAEIDEATRALTVALEPFESQMAGDGAGEIVVSRRRSLSGHYCSVLDALDCAELEPIQPLASYWVLPDQRPGGHRFSTYVRWSLEFAGRRPDGQVRRYELASGRVLSTIRAAHACTEHATVFLGCRLAWSGNTAIGRRLTAEEQLEAMRTAGWLEKHEVSA